MNKSAKTKSTYEKEYGELVRSELALSQAALDETFTNRLEALAGIRIGLNEVSTGKTSSAKNVFKRMRNKHNIPKPA
jgi:hypothetical protein